MKPLNSNMHLKPEEGCTKISSSCVIWQGPDIPCIDLCKGDSVTDVVYKLATLLCEMTTGVIDISSLDFKCIIDEGVAEPRTLVAALQAIIDKQCYFEDNCCSATEGGRPAPISLPACLYYTEGGDEITALLPEEYSQYLAQKICDVITEITSIKTNIANLQSRVTNLETNLSGGGTGATISVTTQCASGDTPGAVLPIGQAFTAFESKFCQLTTLLGTNAALSTAISKECAGLDSAPQLSNDAAQMSAIPGWVATPTTLSETIVNMWLTICDMRSAIESVISGTTTGCVPLPVTNLQITNLSSSGSTITWTAPAVGDNENPYEYNIQVFEWNGTSTVGAPILNTNKPYPATSQDITIVPDPAKNYIVKVVAQYSCESSVEATTIGKIALTSVLYCVSVTDVAHDEITETCDGNSYVTKRRKTTLTLKDISTGTTVGNAYAPFTVDINYDVTGDCSPLIESVTKTFATGVAIVEHIYAMEQYVKCGADPCTPKYKTYSCVTPPTGDRATICAGEEICPT